MEVWWSSGKRIGLPTGEVGDLSLVSFVTLFS